MVAALATPAAAETLRVATFHTELSRAGPGLLLRDLDRGAPDVDAVVAMITEASPDVIVLQDIDYDADGAALGVLTERLADAGIDLPHSFAARPNAGMATGLDLDGDGYRGDARDAQGYGQYSGDGGMAVLSRFPIGAVTDLSPFLWRDLPEANPPSMTEEVAAIQRLSSVAHWIVPVETPGGALTLLTWHATPPVFDGPEDRNGRRADDEAALWLRVLDGALDMAPPERRFVVLGVGNVDPVDGEGRREAIRALLNDPRLTDPEPRSEGARAAADADHLGDPALDTSDYDGPGNLRTSFVLPSADLTVLDAGVLWPNDLSRFGAPENLSRHRLVWVDIALD
ncbi:hypothetical protein PARPLA_00053 [Rhodobacteraceae bacterium THAF1]|uniref:endonuclease/exonuclease/phosphatase family protein n=1 Tax=Palleronia sp. THAF1 TaxID=2587842 RepID=UPI000F3D9CCF|nr:endonuclease/exonuclease/phosphatase family protein [Palleronia sp. THAF1]QFU07133.1 hypothetical protein FIU81_00370 [Palleronia sp. THAF1]VDC16714.1 hypothetical protein PARPLA_00053 [Rhodobacteraceae bacterium THAF1]